MGYKKSNNAGGLYAQYQSGEYRKGGFLSTILVIGLLVAAVAAGATFL